MPEPTPRLPGGPTTYPSAEVPEPSGGYRMGVSKGDDLRYHGAVEPR